MKIRKSQYESAIVTAIISIIILLILFFTGMAAERNEMDEGVMVSFGNFEDGYGEQTPEPEQAAQPTQATTVPTAPQPTPTTSEKLVTQQDPSVAIEQERRRRQEEAEQRRQEEEAKKAQAARIAGSAFKSVGAGQGSGSGDGQKGNPVGRGSEGGNSWSLNGRSLKGRLAQPSYKGNDQGRIVVNIRVDQQGRVVDASIGTGTTITSEQMRQAALQAAKKNVFSTGNSPAVGTITYNFTLN